MFVGQHISVAFEADPEEDIRQLNQRRNELERALAQYEENTQQQRQHYTRAKESLNLLNKLIPQVNILMDETLIDRVEELREGCMLKNQCVTYSVTKSISSIRSRLLLSCKVIPKHMNNYRKITSRQKQSSNVISNRLSCWWK